MGIYYVYYLYIVQEFTRRVLPFLAMKSSIHACTYFVIILLYEVAITIEAIRSCMMNQVHITLWLTAASKEGKFK